MYICVNTITLLNGLHDQHKYNSLKYYHPAFSNQYAYKVDFS